MSRQRVSPGEITAKTEFLWGRSMKAALKRHAKRLKKTPAEICRDVMTKHVRHLEKHAHKLAVSKRANKAGQKSFPVRMAAATKKKRRRR